MESDVLVDDMNNIFVDLADSTSASHHHLQDVPVDELNDGRLNQHIFSLQDNSHSSSSHQFQEIQEATNEQEPEFKVSNSSSSKKMGGVEKENQPETRQEQEIQIPEADEFSNEVQGNQNSGLVDMKTAIFQCQFCTDRHDIKDLHNHLRKIHRARIQYMCNICETIFTHIDDLRQHLEIHQSGQDPNLVPNKIPTRRKRKRKRKTEESIDNATTQQEDSTTKTKGEKQKIPRKKDKKKIESNVDEQKLLLENLNQSQSKPKGAKDEKNELQSSSQQEMDNDGDDWFTSFNDNDDDDDHNDHIASPLVENHDDWGWDTDILGREIVPTDSTTTNNTTSNATTSTLLNTINNNTTTTTTNSSSTLTPTTVLRKDKNDEKGIIANATGLQFDNSFKREQILKPSSSSSTEFRCLYSGCTEEGFQTKELLDIHEKFHIAKVVMDFMCGRCRKFFDSVQAYEKHEKSRACKNNKKKFLCRTCGHAFRNQGERVYHNQVHTGIKLFRCEEEGCGKEFTTNKAMARHHRLIHAPAVEKPYVCTVCKKPFAEELDLRHHFRYHADRNRYSCTLCKKKFFTRTHLTVHMRRHRNERPFKCPVENCDRSFVTNPEVRRHLRNHQNSRGEQATRLPGGPGYVPVIRDETGVPIFKCETCNKTFSVRDNFKKHLRIHDPDRQPYSCDTCGKKYLSRHSLKVHQVLHEDDSMKKYSCTQCPKKFMTENRLKSHQNQHAYQASRARGVCEICGKTLNSRLGLKVHMERHQDAKNYICSQCGKACKTKGDLKFHEYTHLEIPPFKCEFCDFRCTHPTNVYHHIDLEHIRIVDGQYVFVESKTEERRLERAKKSGEEIDPTTMIPKNFICEICSTTWSTEKNLEYHQLYHKDERSNVCKKCKEKFVSKYDLWIHQKQHRSPKIATVSCTICSKYCGTKRGLESHMRYNHTMESPFACTECPRAFKSKSDLTYHLVTHTGAYKYCCDICGKKAITKGNFNAHMKTHDKSIVDNIKTRPLHTCPLEGCPVTFRSKILLKQHLLNHQIKGELTIQNSQPAPAPEANQNVGSENHQSQGTNQEGAQRTEIPNMMIPNNNWTYP